MKILNLVLIILIILFSACIGNSNKNKSPNSNSFDDNENSQISEIESLINTFDSTLLQYEKIIVDSITNKDKILELYKKNGTPKKLIIQNNLKDSPNIFKEEFYFGENSGFPLVYTYKISKNRISIQSIFKDRNVVSYVKNEKNIYNNEFDDFIKETKISAITYILIDNLSYFKNVKLEFLKPSINSIPVIIVSDREVEMYKTPNLKSPIIQNLSKYELLFFLDYSRVSADNQIWYKVSKEDKETIGWIKAYKNSINFYTDGD